MLPPPSTIVTVTAPESFDGRQWSPRSVSAFSMVGQFDALAGGDADDFSMGSGRPRRFPKLLAL